MIVKICGITHEDDANLAVAMGADAVGFVFAPSPRQVAIGAARDIARRLDPSVITVGVFRDAVAHASSTSSSKQGSAPRNSPAMKARRMSPSSRRRFPS